VTGLTTGCGHRPRVSVVLASHNHALYVEQAVRSVLSQTFEDVELIVVDDGSVDGTPDVLASICDPRVAVLRLVPSHGACAALNLAVQQARGDLIAVLNSDDVWEPRKLERQVGVLDDAPDVAAVFTAARLIDGSGKPLAVRAMPPWHSIFRQPNRSRARWLRYFFERGNALCHPSVLIRRSVFDSIGYYDNRFRQLPDFDRWIALVKHAPFLVLGEEELVQFRVHLNHGNASSPSLVNRARSAHEQLVICRSFFEGCPSELFHDAFGDLFVDPMAATPDELACEQMLLWLHAPSLLHPLYRFFGIGELYRLLGQPATRDLLRRRYGITDLYAHELAAELADDGGRSMVDVGGWFAPTFARREVAIPPSSGDLARELVSRARRVAMWKWPHRITHHLRRRRA
jgi:glycosyltransferase involved in cell wall biosynthesis